MNEEEKKKLISEYMKELANKSHVAVFAKYGREHYVAMGKLSHKKREEKKEAPLAVLE